MRIHFGCSLALVAAVGCGSGEDDAIGSSDAMGGTSGEGADAGSATGAAGSGGASTGGSGARGGSTDGMAGASGAPSGSRADVIGRAAAVIGSCIEDDGVNRNNMHMWYGDSIPRIWGRYGAQADCLASHGGGCDAVVECIGWEFATVSPNCVSGCSEDTYTLCGEAFQVRIDCPKLGLQCDGDAICADGASASCDPSVFVSTCEADGRPTFCDDDAVFRGVECATLGLTCAEGGCVGTGDACAGDPPSYSGVVEYFGLACSGETLQACVGGQTHELDCTTLGDGFSCRERDGFVYCGLGDECLPAIPDGSGYGDAVACDGTNVVYCNAGRIERVDCTSLGFEGCNVDDWYGCTPGFY